MSIFFLCTTFGQISPPCFWAQNFWNLRFAEKAGLHISSWDGIHLTFLIEDGWHLTFLFTLQKRRPQIELTEKKVCISWQLKPPWRLRQGVNLQLVPKRFNQYLPNKPAHTQRFSANSFWDQSSYSVHRRQDVWHTYRKLLKKSCLRSLYWSYMLFSGLIENRRLRLWGAAKTCFPVVYLLQ